MVFVSFFVKKRKQSPRERNDFLEVTLLINFNGCAGIEMQVVCSLPST